MKCGGCGAEVSPDAAKCDYCGSSVEPVSEPSPEAIFAKIKASPEYARRDARERLAALPEYPAVARTLAMAVPIVFIAISGIIAVGMLVMAGVVGVGIGMAGGGGLAGFSVVPAVMSLVPIGFVVVGVWMLVSFRKKFRQFDEAPVTARPAIVVGKRTAVFGGSGDSSAGTRYFLSAEFEDGSRQEFQVMTPDLYGRSAEDDAGVLFTRAAIALAFDRIKA